MPINKDDFKRGLNDDVRKILNFLLENKDNAFTLTEVTDAIGFGRDKTVKVLGYLREKRFVKVKDIGGTFYYIFERKP